ncbi:MAG: hypothetical protein II597_09795, partial [Prevotella sp.]|nr:hypothetical protein [Prevotella sp.]
MKRLLIFAWALIATFNATAQVSFGKSQIFNDDWLFMQADDANAWKEDYNDQRWRKLNLPHDYSIEGIMSPDLASCT